MWALLKVMRNTFVEVRRASEPSVSIESVSDDAMKIEKKFVDDEILSKAPEDRKMMESLKRNYSEETLLETSSSRFTFRFDSLFLCVCRLPCLALWCHGFCLDVRQCGRRVFYCSG